MKIVVAQTLAEAIMCLNNDVDIAIIEVRQATTYCKIVVRSDHVQLIQEAMTWRLGAMAGGHRIFVAQNTTLEEARSQLGGFTKEASLGGIGIIQDP